MVERHAPKSSCPPQSKQAFVSYAQNFEDVMLWRALKHVENGFYLDVGANDPVIDSVSKAFYDRGWRGVHIEPVPEFADELRKMRPDETVLEVALSDTNGTIIFNSIPNTGISTAIDAYAEESIKKHGFEVHRIQVPCLRLETAVQFLGEKQVHWMKIDVEGLEEQVLKGWNSRTFRPWVIVIEATAPGSTQVRHECWESILTEGSYEFAYFDGLNRFYVASEHRELLSAFSVPPNVFDGVQLNGSSSSPWCDKVFAELQESLATGRLLAKQLHEARHLLSEQTKQTAYSETELLRQIHVAAQRESELTSQVCQAAAREEATSLLERNQREKGAFRLRQLLRHPKVYFRESFGLKTRPKPRQFPQIKNGCVDEFGELRLSFCWICRQPGKAMSLFVRQPRKAFRYILRQPSKFLSGKATVSSSGRHLPQNDSGNESPVGRGHLSPEASIVFKNLKLQIQKAQANADHN